jgi:site-specific DNA recombinase
MNGQTRCAIYTRKSSEEGLEQSFNSLHAQREACEAYIISQRHEGWLAISTNYDDGGFSGGSTDRPGLKQLLADITAGKIDTVVVYKVDRLTRSLADFAKIVELFDSKKVSFVSVTQQFNTTTSMGRLTLNVLLSFAQFEREVTGERIRDKIAASKAKGMWMGGPVPLGYDLRDRRLYTNEAEAERVREIYRQYLRVGCVARLKEYLDTSTVFSKSRVGGRWKERGAKHFSRGALYRILKNHLYVGEIAHKDRVHEGEHEAIIDRQQWLEVQAKLAENMQGPRQRHKLTKGNLLTGIVFDGEGNRLTPTHANKAGKRYRYYTSQSVIRKGTAKPSITRISAIELEQAVLGRIERFLSLDDDLLGFARSQNLLGRPLEDMFNYARNLAETWKSSEVDNQQRMTRSALMKVVVRQNLIEITLNASLLLDCISESSRSDEPSRSSIVTLTCAFQPAHRGQELRLIVKGVDQSVTQSTEGLVKAVARARLWYEEIVAGEVGSTSQLATKHNFHPSYVKRILRCAMLSPNGVEAVLAGDHSPTLTVDVLANRLPAYWIEQNVEQQP